MAKAKGILTTKQAAEVLNVHHKNAVRVLLAAGVQGVKLSGSLWAWPEEAVKQLAEERKNDQRPEGWITTAEAVKIIGIEYAGTVQLLSRQGLSNMKIGHNRYWPEEMVKRLARAREDGRGLVWAQVQNLKDAHTKALDNILEDALAAEYDPAQLLSIADAFDQHFDRIIEALGVDRELLDL